MKKNIAKLIKLFHTLFVIYFLIIIPFAITGVLSKYNLLNNLTFSASLITILFLVTTGCPLTIYESDLSGRKKEIFTIRFFRNLGIKISRKFARNLWIFIFGSIIISYLVY